jgi:hypothetical protein
VNPVPIVIVVTAGALLGLHLGWLFLRRGRGRPAVIGLHVILGVIGLEGVAMLISGAPDGSDPATGRLVRMAGLFLVLAVMTGFAAPLLSKRRPRRVGLAAVGAHAAVAATGYVLLIAWAMRA